MSCEVPRVRTREAPPRIRTREAPPRLCTCAVVTPPHYERTFTNGDLVAGILAVAHSRNTLTPIVAVYDSNGDEVIFVPVHTPSANSIAIDLGLETIIGTWRLGLFFTMYNTTFDADDDRIAEVDGETILTIEHGRGQLAPLVGIYTDTGNRMQLPVHVVDEDTLEVNLTGITLDEPWRLGVA